VALKSAVEPTCNIDGLRKEERSYMHREEERLTKNGGEETNQYISRFVYKGEKRAMGKGLSRSRETPAT